MSTATPGPRCPQCHRQIAAWRLAHCVYCGANFPPGLKDGFEEPDALKWVERPPISGDAVRQLEVMKVMRLEPGRKPRPLLIFAAGISLAAFATIFILLFLLLQRSMPSLGFIVLIIGAVFLGYLVVVFRRAFHRGTG